jgi:hypothetical protein
MLWRHFKDAIIESTLSFRKLSRITVDMADGSKATIFSAALARIADHNTRFVSLNVSTTISQALHESRYILMGGAGAARTFTLPNATGSGAIYRFVVGAVNTSNYLIKSNRGADVLKGQVINTNSGSSGAARGWYPGATDDTITLNGTTTGGANVGDWIEVVDAAANTWVVNGVTTGTGTVTTPFSDTVA